MKKKPTLMMLFLVVLALVSAGCRGYRSEKPPFHLNPNMDWQAKYKAQTLTLDVPSGTVAWGDKDGFEDPASRQQYLKPGTAFFTGKNSKGVWTNTVPVDVTKTFVEYGRERFNIYCAACHDKAGTGKGIVISRGFVAPPDLSDPRVRALKDGELFDIISNGIRTMPAYAKQLPEKDRWAVVTYVRALQRSRQISRRQLDKNLLSKIEANQ